MGQLIYLVQLYVKPGYQRDLLDVKQITLTHEVDVKQNQMSWPNVIRSKIECRQLLYHENKLDEAKSQLLPA